MRSTLRSPVSVSLTALIAAALLPVTACEEPAEDVAVLLTIQFESPIDELDQLSVSVGMIPTPLDSTDVVEVVPGTPADILGPGDSPLTVLVMLPPRLYGKTTRLGVLGLLRGEVVGHGTATLIPQRGQVVQDDVVLIPGAPECGNGVQESAEQCDGTDFVGLTCATVLGLDSGDLRCNAQTCRIDASGCSECGNGAVERPVEQCDGDVGDETCWSRGFATGVLRCGATCQYDVTGCQGGCGNGVIEAGEGCDGADLGGARCEDLPGAPVGVLACGADCQLDASGCHTCGDGRLEADEACDGAAFGGQTCATLGFGAGDLRCGPGCVIDVSGCCGDGTAGPAEDCDGTDLRGQTCLTATGRDGGELACTADCQLDKSGCQEPGFCGDGVLAAGEACDESAFGGQTCATLGYGAGDLRCASDCTVDHSGCCGDGVAGPAEACDGADVGGQTCLTAAGHTQGTLGCTATCHLDVSACHTCGNGAIDGPSEACDGAELGSATCATEVPGASSGALTCLADCTLDTSDCVVCGDGVAGEGEVCDGADLRGATCLSLGYRQQAGSVLACQPGCGGYDPSGCVGGPIATATDIAGAIADAHATGAHQVIRLPEGAYTLTTPIVLDECGGACGGGRPFGVTLEPEPGAQVMIVASGVAVAFDVVTGENVLRDLLFSEAATAFLLRSGADAGGNRVAANRFENHARAPGVLIDVRSSGNEIVANLIDNQWIAAAGTAAVDLSAGGNTVAMNVVYGRFTWALDAQNLAPATLTTFIDHNSLWVTSGGGGVRLENADELCYRNNIVHGDGSGTGLRLLNTASAFAASTACGGYRATNNVNRNHLLACAGDAGDCASYCASSAGSFRLCDLAVDPGWVNPDLCLMPAFNVLVDAGIDLGYDLVDGLPETFVGAGPDVGAREYGTSRMYAGYTSSCP